AANGAGVPPKVVAARPRAAGGLPIRRRLTTCPTSTHNLDSEIRRGARRNEWIVVHHASDSTLMSCARGPWARPRALPLDRLRGPPPRTAGAPIGAARGVAMELWEAPDLAVGVLVLAAGDQSGAAIVGEVVIDPFGED